MSPFLTSTFSHATNRWRREGDGENEKETHKGVGYHRPHSSASLHHQNIPFMRLGGRAQAVFCRPVLNKVFCQVVDLFKDTAHVQMNRLLMTNRLNKYATITVLGLLFDSLMAGS